jgi:hypothetical protein
MGFLWHQGLVEPSRHCLQLFKQGLLTLLEQRAKKVLLKPIGTEKSEDVFENSLWCMGKKRQCKMPSNVQPLGEGGLKETLAQRGMWNRNTVRML